MEADSQPYQGDGSRSRWCAPTSRARSTPWRCRPTPCDAGLKDFADIAKFKDQLDGKIYGIEPGNDGNRLILDMIDEQHRSASAGSSWSRAREQGMLAQVERAEKQQQADRVPRLGAAPDEHATSR